MHARDGRHPVSAIVPKGTRGPEVGTGMYGGMGTGYGRTGFMSMAAGTAAVGTVP